jgi:hypothetical protein
MRKQLLIAVAALCGIAAAHAQAPSPAQVGLVPGSPNYFQVLDSSKTWVTLGSINPTTHVFSIPSANVSGLGALAAVTPTGTPAAGTYLDHNYAWSVPGGGGGSSITGYATHAALLAGVTAFSTNTITQDGFYETGDGGYALYKWNANSLCGVDINRVSQPADGVTCILPTTQGSAVAGRYLLQIAATVNGRALGFRATTAAQALDNYPIVQAAMNAMGPPNTAPIPNATIWLPPIVGNNATAYYFSRSFFLSRAIVIKCGDTTGSVQLVFQAGQKGVIQEDAKFSPDGGTATGSNVIGCRIVSSGTAVGGAAYPSQNTITSAIVRKGDYNSQTPASIWQPGDGIVVVPEFQNHRELSYFLVPPGTTVTSVASLYNLTLSNNIDPQFAAADANFEQNGTNNVLNGDAFVIGNNTFHFANPLGSTPGNVLPGGDFIGSGVNLAACINTPVTTSTCVAPTNTPNVTADVPYTSYWKFWAAAGGAAGNSLVSTYTPAGVSAGNFIQGTFGGGTPGEYTVATQLPGPNAVSPNTPQNFTVETTLGSNVVTVSAMPTGRAPFSPTEMVWNDAFLPGTLVGTVQAAGRFTQIGSNNFVNGDAIAVNYEGFTNTYNMVTVLGTTPGNTLIGPDFSHSASNINDNVNGLNYKSSTLSAAVTSGVTTSVAIAACPSPFSPGEPVWDLAGTPRQLGIAANCVSNSISFSGTATASGAIGDPINFRTYIPTAGGPNNSSTFTPTTITMLGEQSGPFNGMNGTQTYTPVGTPAGAFNAPDWSKMQSLTMVTIFDYTAANATKSEVGGSMWGIPAGLKRDATSFGEKNQVNSFPIGLEMECSGGFLQGYNCTGSRDRGGTYSGDMFGRLTGGNNTSGSISDSEEFVDNFGMDVGEFATLSSTYINPTTHSPESGGSNVGILMNCSSLNGSFAIGGYYGLGSNYGQYPGCQKPGGILFDATPGGMLIMFPADSWPFGARVFGGGSFRGGGWSFLGGPNDTSCASMGSTGPGMIFSFNYTCGAGAGSQYGWNWNTALGAWDFQVGVGSPTPLTRQFAKNLGFTGYSTGPFGIGVEFPQGIKLWNPENASFSAISGRDLTMGSTPGTQTWEAWGAARLNTQTVPGGNAGWTNAATFQTTLGANVIAGTTLNVAVAACPAVALPAGTLIGETPTFTLPPFLIGTLATCPPGTTTLTLQAAAVHAATSGDPIQFTQPFPDDLVARDPNGVVYGQAAVAIAALPGCAAGMTGAAWINNGLAAPTYRQAVSTTGPATEPVYCVYNGTAYGWAY